LTRAGIAVLRVDDRGVGKSTGNLQQSTLEDLTGDVLTGIGYLKSRKEIDPQRIGLVGHSERWSRRWRFHDRPAWHSS